MSKQNHVKVFIQPFDDSGTYTGVWTEVTDDVVFDDLSDVLENLDNTDYTLGVFRTSSVNLSLINESGKYSDVDVAQSIFRFRRAGSLVRFVFDIENEGNYCGTAICGDAYLTDDDDNTVLFEGLLDDSSLSLNLTDRKQKFNVLGKESFFDSTLVNFASLSAGVDHISVLLYKILNQSPITSVLTVAQINIVPAVDQIPDDISSFEDAFVKDVLDQLLLASNSVLYIQDNTIYVAGRTATADVKYTFHGQASESARENIVNLENITSGLARTFNRLAWEQNAVVVQDASSITLCGALSPSSSINIDSFTNTTKRTNILNAILAEFKDPLKQLDVTTVLNYDTFALKLLDRVEIDYPTVYVATEGNLPIFGVAVFGVDVFPRGLWGFTENTSTNYKIVGITRKLKYGQVTFSLRKV